MMNNEEIIREIYDTLNVCDIDICYIYGKFLTDKFSEDEYIYLAILGGIQNFDRIAYESRLTRKIGIVVKLNFINYLPYHYQFQIISRNEKVIFKYNKNSAMYLYSMYLWYKEEYSFYMKLINN